MKISDRIPWENYNKITIVTDKPSSNLILDLRLNHNKSLNLVQYIKEIDSFEPLTELAFDKHESDAVYIDGVVHTMSYDQAQEFFSHAHVLASNTKAPTFYIKINEGDKSGKLHYTKKGYHRNLPASIYHTFIKDNGFIVMNTITAKLIVFRPVTTEDLHNYIERLSNEKR